MADFQCQMLRFIASLKHLCQLACRVGQRLLSFAVHECRLTVEEEFFVATLVPRRELRLLDLSELLEEGVTEFESVQGRGS